MHAVFLNIFDSENIIYNTHGDSYNIFLFTKNKIVCNLNTIKFDDLMNSGYFRKNNSYVLLVVRTLYYGLEFYILRLLFVYRKT